MSCSVPPIRNLIAARVLWGTVLCLFWGTSPAAAFKLETHVWIAQQVLNDLLRNDPFPCTVALVRYDLQPDGSVIEGKKFGDFKVEPAICESLRAHAGQYRMGSIGPDAFPDIPGGQMTTHPGVTGSGGWQTDDWLRWVLDGAVRPRAEATSETLAFAYGFLTHAAGDVFAHSYVNAYSGDIFDLEIGNPNGERQVELRHIALETYIKNFTPPLAGPTGVALGRTELNVELGDEVVRYIRDRLILNSTVAGQYGRQPATRHLKAMYDFWHKLGVLISDVDSLVQQVNGYIEQVDASIADIEGRISEVKKKKVCAPDWLGGGCVRVYPAYCLVDPGTCAAVVALEITLSGARASFAIAQRANELTGESVKAPLELWRSNVEEAITQYVVTSFNVARSILRSDLDLPDHEKAKAQLTNWLCQYGPAFGGVPPELTGLACTPGQQLSELTSNIRRAREEFDETPLAWFIDPLGAFNARIQNELDHGLLAKLTKLFIGDESEDCPECILLSLAHMREERVTAEALNDEFGQDSSNKNLLIVPGMNAAVESDMHVGDSSQFNALAFHPVHNAILLSKLLLLGPAELNRLAESAGVNISIYGPNLYEPAASFNVLFDAVKSIDGNHQWQEFGLPYPRRSGADTEPHQYGYAFLPENPKGFRLWQDCLARKNVFLELFKGPIAPSLSPLVLPRDANWESVDNPFPFARTSIDPPHVVDDPLLGRILLCGSQPVPPASPAPAGYEPPLPPDTVKPVLLVPNPITVECTGAGPRQLVDIGQAVAYDNRDRDPTVTNDAPLNGFEKHFQSLTPPLPGSPPPPSRFSFHSVKWMAVDDAGNRIEAAQGVTLRDFNPPRFVTGRATPGDSQTFNLLPVVVTAAGRDGTLVPVPIPRVIDACHGEIAPTPVLPLRRPISGRLLRPTFEQLELPLVLPVGETTIGWLAVDLSGNQSIAWQSIEVRATRGDLDLDGDVDSADLSILSAARNQPVRSEPVLRDFDGNGAVDDVDSEMFKLFQAGSKDPRDLNEDNKIDALDSRILVTLCTRARCATQ